MFRALLGVGAAALLVVALMLRPFLPGDHDRLASAVQTMMQFFALAGIVLVPFGIFWWVTEWRNAPRARRVAALLAIGVATVVAGLLTLAAFFAVGPTLGVPAAAVWVVVAARLFARATRTDHEARAFDPTPVHLVVLPLVALLTNFAILPRVEEHGRNRAIDNSSSLITDIERFRSTHGRYPASMLSVWQDYKPGVIGVPQYHYEPSGAAYSLWFEQPSHVFGTREFVVYNPRGEQQMTSHDSDLLRFTGDDLERRRGYYASRDASRPGWKRFLFD
jgi:hypothetical protein